VTTPDPATGARSSDHELLNTLFALGSEVASVLDLDELLRRVPDLIRRLVDFHAFAVYLLDEAQGELSIAFAVGYPEDVVSSLRIRVGESLVGASVAEGRPILVNDVPADARYVEAVPGTRSELVVPLRRKGKVLGALNLLSRNRDEFSETEEALLRQFAAAVAVAIENARLFEREREYAETLEILAEIGREVTAILDLDELLTRLAAMVGRLVDYRTFGIMFLNEQTGELEMKLAVQYGERTEFPKVRLGGGLVGYAAKHKKAVLVGDVLRDPRYIKVVEDVRSELVIPLLVKDRCIGVFDLESPELDAFDKRDVEILTLLAGHAAVAIENARLYERIRENEERMENELRFAQRVQAALLPAGLPKRIRNVDGAARFAPARELGGDLYDFLSPEPNVLVVAVGDVSGKGVPAALYGAFAGEIVRSRTFRRRYQPDAASPGAILGSVNTILHERQLEEYYCTLACAWFDLKRRLVFLANSGLPYPFRCSGGACAPIEIAGVPLGTFGGTVYDETTFELRSGDLFVFCTDGVFETVDPAGHEFGADRLAGTIARVSGESAATVVEAVFEATEAFRGDGPQHDDMTVVAVRIAG
jgi:sigma-B regulation protein RsbU (phosphoserine phosphatase)